MGDSSVGCQLYMIGNREEISRLKALECLDSCGINVINVLAVYLYEVSSFSVLRRLVRSLFWVPFIDKKECVGSNVLVLHGCKGKKRKDYDSLVEVLRQRSVEKTDYVEVVDKFKLQAFFLVAWNFPGLFFLLKKSGVGVNRSMVLALYYARFVGLGRELGDVLAKYDSLVTFCDAHPYDNFAAQMANTFGMHTYTLQHGQYRNIDDAANPDNEAILNFVSDKLLCWGRKTVDEFVRAGYDAYRFEIVGWLRGSGFQPESQCNQDSDVSRNNFGVLFSGENSKYINFDLLRMADAVSKCLNCSYVVRMHPDNCREEYVGFTGENFLGFSVENEEDFFSRLRFSIGYATGAVFISLENECPCYIYKDDDLPVVFDDDKMTFSTALDLVKKLESDFNCSGVLSSYLAPGVQRIGLMGNDL